jgi:hypothetical protein
MVTAAGKQLIKTLGQGRNPSRGKVTIADAPAGGTGATAGAYDTANNRNAMIASLNSLLAVCRSIGLIA